MLKFVILIAGHTNAYFEFGSKNIPKSIPHDPYVEREGEDAWAVSSNLLVVADGVGGWEERGIDAGLFSRALVKDIKANVDKNPDEALS